MVHGIRERQSRRGKGRGERLWPWSRMTGWRAVHAVMEAAGLDGPQASPKGLLATPPLFLEYEEVLKRPEQRTASRLSLKDVDTALEALAALIEPVEAHLSWRPQLPDPDDEMVLEAAINGHAAALVTYNAAHFQPAATRFGLRLARPAEILHQVIEL